MSPEIGDLIDDLQKLRHIVQRQKAEVARREGVPSNALLTSTEDSNAVAHPVATFTDSEPSRLPVNRKVAECSSPPAYRGFSSVIHISRERTCNSARSSAPQTDLHTRSRKVAHPTLARSGGMVTTSDWRLGSQLIQKFFGSKIEQSPTQSVDQTQHLSNKLLWFPVSLEESDRLVSPNSRSLLHQVDVKVTEEEPRTASAKDTNDGETAISNSQILNDGPRVGSTMHSLEEDVANADAPSLVGQKRPAGMSVTTINKWISPSPSPEEVHILGLSCIYIDVSKIRLHLPSAGLTFPQPLY
ncbi:unnamed protein product [Dibothriocephalus latus]|uniref:Uncharacterized protein n=1 Tax=Dibothriocephalus latus TaxID=60516 RepID=A0A3P7PGL1_DIBLA|nr:unnamed protein product [Dibothriocephalus latus]